MSYPEEMPNFLYIDFRKIFFRRLGSFIPFFAPFPLILQSRIYAVRAGVDGIVNLTFYYVIEGSNGRYMISSAVER